MSTFMAKPGQVPQRWHVIDATDKVVGRLAVQIANILRGKHRPEYTPHLDTGEFVVVINAAKIKFTGNKMATKTYATYSHYPGGYKTVTAQQLLAKRPEKAKVASKSVTFSLLKASLVTRMASSVESNGTSIPSGKNSLAMVSIM